MVFKNLGKKLKDIQKNIIEERTKKVAKEKRIRKGKKRIRDFKFSEQGKNKLVLRWQGREQKV